MKISKYFTLAEATKSQMAVRKSIVNEPTDSELENMKFLAVHTLDKVREFVGGPLAVTSFFRSEILNVLLGGSKTSRHCKGQAADIDCDVFDNSSNREIFYFIKDNITFDQLIWEFGDTDQPAWVHVGVKSEGNRSEVLRVYHTPDGNTRYVPFDLSH